MTQSRPPAIFTVSKDTFAFYCAGSLKDDQGALIAIDLDASFAKFVAVLRVAVPRFLLDYDVQIHTKERGGDIEDANPGAVTIFRQRYRNIFNTRGWIVPPAPPKETDPAEENHE